MDSSSIYQSISISPHLIKTNSTSSSSPLRTSNILHPTSYIPHQEVKRTSLIKHPSSLINPAPMQSCRMATAHPHIRTERTSEHARTTLTVNGHIELVPQVFLNS